MSELQRTHLVTIKRLVDIDQTSATRDSTGGQKRSYTKAARGGLPTQVRCRAMLMSAKERIDLGVRSDLEGWKFLFFEGDPQLDLTDRLEFEYVDGQSQTVKVLTGSHARSADARFWRCYGEEDGTES